MFQIKQNNINKMNQPNHPSYQSKFKPHKFSIKVDYKVIHSNRDHQSTKKQGKKLFQNKINLQKQSFSRIQESFSNVSRVKSVSNRLKQFESGKFVQSEYCPLEKSRINESQNGFQKGKVLDAALQYQHSKSVEHIIKDQYSKKRVPSCFVSSSRLDKQQTQFCKNSCSNSKITAITKKLGLPSYSNQGIKDIIEYEHARRYREQRITPKCTNNNNIKDKFRGFNEIHQFDFRKRVNTLSNQANLMKGLR